MQGDTNFLFDIPLLKRDRRPWVSLPSTPQIRNAVEAQLLGATDSEEYGL